MSARDVIEAMARAYWNENPTRAIGATVPLGETGTTYKHLGYVLWDDADMSEIDREVTRNKARAALRAAEAAGFRLAETALVGELVAALRGATLNDRLQYEADILRRADEWLAAAPKAGEGGSDPGDMR